MYERIKMLGTARFFSHPAQAGRTPAAKPHTSGVTDGNGVGRCGVAARGSGVAGQLDSTA